MDTASRDEARFEDFTGLIAAISKEVTRIKSVESAKLGLTGADIMCLYYLGKHPQGMTGAELARAASVTRAAVSRALARSRMLRQSSVFVLRAPTRSAWPGRNSSASRP